MVEAKLNGLCTKYPKMLVGGDFNAIFQLMLDSSNQVPNEWVWLQKMILGRSEIEKGRLVHRPKQYVGMYRAHHPGAREYKKFASGSHDSSNRLDLVLASIKFQ